MITIWFSIVDLAKDPIGKDLRASKKKQLPQLTNEIIVFVGMQTSWELGSAWSPTKTIVLFRASSFSRCHGWIDARMPTPHLPKQPLRHKVIIGVTPFPCPSVVL
jgi:hypothetical protein